MPRNLSPWLKDLDELGSMSLRRRTMRRGSGPPGKLSTGGRDLVDLSSNSYLGLHAHPSLLAAITPEFSGSTASRLMTGTWQAHESLEAELATFHGSPDAVLFNSGYCANLGVIEALAAKDCVVFSDALNHASIIDGVRLSRAETHIFRHNDVSHLRDCLLQFRSGATRAVIVCESIYSMDGDRAPLDKIAELAEAYDCLLIVDEAHAVGVSGDGRGVCHEVGVSPDVLIGTLGKAFASYGAYACATTPIAEFLRNRARTFIYTTSLPDSVLTTTRRSLKIVASTEGDALRRKLSSNVELLVEALDLPRPSSHIIPIIVRSAEEALDLSRQLRSEGILAQAVRPPTVPPDSSRLRLSLSASLDADTLALCAGKIKRLTSRA